MIQQTFGRIPRSLSQPSPAAAAVNAELLAGAGTAAAANGSSNGVAAEANGSGAGGPVAGVGTPSGAILESTTRPRGLLRPPVEHQWGCTSPPVHPGPPHAPVSVFRHHLLQLFQLSIFCKLPVMPINTLQDLRCGPGGCVFACGLARPRNLCFLSCKR